MLSYLILPKNIFYNDKMKELLIIFVILLVLLMLISTFGGSIRQKESFYQVVQEESVKEEIPLFQLPPIPQPNLTPLPSNPPFDMPSQITDLKNLNVEPFQQQTYGGPAFI